MNTKLTLRMDSDLVLMAKTEARRRGKSVSQMVGEFFDALTAGRTAKISRPPLTASLAGALKGKGVAVEDYRKHLREKFS
jgi:hypothetical protein